MDQPSRRIFTLRVFRHNEDCDEIERGFTRADDENLNSIRIGWLVIAWGLEHW